MQEEAMELNLRTRDFGVFFFFSGVFALEGFFLTDLCDSFTYTRDTLPTAAASSSSSSSSSPGLLTRRYPSIKRVLSLPWRQLVSKHTALSPTFLKSRLLALYRCKSLLFQTFPLPFMLE